MTKTDRRGIGTLTDLFLACGNSPQQYLDIGRPCLHERHAENDLKTIAKYIKQLVLSSFRAGLRSIFDHTVAQKHDEVLRAVLCELLEAERSPQNPLILDEALRETSTVLLVKEEIIDRCQEIVSEITLQLALDDVFELLCDLASSHGRDIVRQGPPCACSFALCLHCLEALVDFTMKMPAPCMEQELNACTCCWVRPSGDRELEQSTQTAASGEGSSKTVRPSAVNVFEDTWDALTLLFWEVKRRLHPLEFPQVSKVVATIKRANGLILWHTVVARNLRRPNVKRKGKSKEIIDSKKVKTQSKEDAQEMLVKASEDTRGESFNKICADTRVELAGLCRTRGNEAFVKADFAGALITYGRAIEYNREDPIFYLNRSAAHLKLGNFTESERDCTTSINLDPTNAKAFFRRGLGRSRQGQIGLAAKDFKQVLFLQRDSEARVYDEWRVLIETHLKEAMSKSLEEKGVKAIEAMQLPSQKEVLAESKQKMSLVIPKKDTEVQNGVKKKVDKSDKSESAVSVQDVFQQVSFAIAFSLILRHHTGVQISIPIQRPRLGRKGQ